MLSLFYYLYFFRSINHLWAVSNCIEFTPQLHCFYTSIAMQLHANSNEFARQSLKGVLAIDWR